MGCDVHIITEFRNPDSNVWSKEWRALNWQPMNPGRNYDLFSKLSGVRGYNEEPIATPGWPEQVSWAANLANTIRVVTDLKPEEHREGCCSMETAEKWTKCGSRFVKDKDGNITGVTHPDWHSHGHCTIEQMSKALRKNSSPEYRAMLAAARSLEKDNMEVRFLFFYDN